MSSIPARGGRANFEGNFGMSGIPTQTCSGLPRRRRVMREGLARLPAEPRGSCRKTS